SAEKLDQFIDYLINRLIVNNSDHQIITEVFYRLLMTDCADLSLFTTISVSVSGVHVYQWMVGCEWDDDAKEVKGYYQDGYDGEDFIAFDLKTKTWIAPTPQALISRQKLDNEKAGNTQRKQYLTEICVDWLKKYVNYGSSSLLRKEPPSVSLLQKTPSSPVSCHATGFYPHRAAMLWRKDGEDLYEGVDQGEILPNHDGTFQMSVDLSSVKPEDRGKYECVFQLLGVKDIVIKLDKSVIKTNEELEKSSGGSDESSAESLNSKTSGN
uniref:Ig-like domain-containing protein n=1 Tax=Seriola lalandi dorsalis TaxID=1841481 RepID=A0A3B4YT36_SERLL